MQGKKDFFTAEALRRREGEDGGDGSGVIMASDEILGEGAGKAIFGKGLTMETKDWMKRLWDTFAQDGILGKMLSDVIEEEKAYGLVVEKECIGQSYLNHAFFDFFMQTMHMASFSWKENTHSLHKATHHEVFYIYLSIFRNLRAINILFYHGYPLEGMVRLRRVFEHAIFIAAIFSGLTTYRKLLGMDNDIPKTDGCLIRIRKNRRAEEKKVNDLMYGKSSNLPEACIKKLEKWKNTMDLEVHSGMPTLMYEFMPMIEGKAPISFHSTPNSKSLGSFVNKLNVVCWLLLRTFPILQFRPTPFGEDWAHKWEVLNDSFRILIDEVENMHNMQDKSFSELVRQKFMFTPDSCIEDIP